jgi:hypothetical protein
MNVDEYRKAYAEQIEKEQGSTAVSNSFAPMSTSAHSADQAASADGADALFKEIAVFRDFSQPTETRLAALGNIQTATFLGPNFDRYRSSFKDALRAVAADDRNQEVRTSAIEVLALNKDDVARQLLLKGLDDAGQALVPVAKALQLLSQDDHGVAIPIARKVIAGTYDIEAKGEALRVLASDPGSDQLFSDILSDRNQPQLLRSVSAVGLRAVNPQKFEQVAQGIVVDEGEDDTVRASALGALNHMQGFAAKVNPDFAAALSKLDLAGKSDSLRTAAARFLQLQSTK